MNLFLLMLMNGYVGLLSMSKKKLFNNYKENSGGTPPLIEYKNIDATNSTFTQTSIDVINNSPQTLHFNIKDVNSRFSIEFAVFSRLQYLDDLNIDVILSNWNMGLASVGKIPLLENGDYIIAFNTSDNPNKRDVTIYLGGELVFHKNLQLLPNLDFKLVVNGCYLNYLKLYDGIVI